jgi:hypothetical protein
VSETAWSGSNGGYSTHVSRPPYQNSYQTNAFRGVPDLSANANPYSGYKICYNLNCYLVGGNFIHKIFLILNTIFKDYFLIKFGLILLFSQST